MKKSKNYLIYGHNIKSGTMFHQLLRFEKESFYKKHKTFKYDQIVDGKQVNGTYRIIAAFRTQIYSRKSKKFKYYRYACIENEKVYKKYIEECGKLSEINTGQKAVYPAQLVTLSTCAYHVENGRFVLVGVRI